MSTVQRLLMLHVNSPVNAQMPRDRGIRPWTLSTSQIDLCTAIWLVWLVTQTTRRAVKSLRGHVVGEHNVNREALSCTPVVRQTMFLWSPSSASPGLIAVWTARARMLRKYSYSWASTWFGNRLASRFPNPCRRSTDYWFYMEIQ